jgi:hypothetical protein
MRIDMKNGWPGDGSYDLGFDVGFAWEGSHNEQGSLRRRQNDEERKSVMGGIPHDAP